ncbi:hypothetical protein GPN2_21516 [Streptomyces murinus]
MNPAKHPGNCRWKLPLDDATGKAVAWSASVICEGAFREAFPGPATGDGTAQPCPAGPVGRRAMGRAHRERRAVGRWCAGRSGRGRGLGGAPVRGRHGVLRRHARGRRHHLERAARRRPVRCARRGGPCRTAFLGQGAARHGGARERARAHGGRPHRPGPAGAVVPARRYDRDGDRSGQGLSRYRLTRTTRPVLPHPPVPAPGNRSRPNPPDWLPPLVRGRFRALPMGGIGAGSAREWASPYSRCRKDRRHFRGRKSWLASSPTRSGSSWPW